MMYTVSNVSSLARSTEMFCTSYTRQSSVCRLWRRSPLNIGPPSQPKIQQLQTWIHYSDHVYISDMLSYPCPEGWWQWHTSWLGNKTTGTPGQGSVSPLCSSWAPGQYKAPQCPTLSSPPDLPTHHLRARATSHESVQVLQLNPGALHPGEQGAVLARGMSLRELLMALPHQLRGKPQNIHLPVSLNISKNKSSINHHLVCSELGWESVFEELFGSFYVVRNAHQTLTWSGPHCHTRNQFMVIEVNYSIKSYPCIQSENTEKLLIFITKWLEQKTNFFYFGHEIAKYFAFIYLIDFKSD